MKTAIMPWDSRRAAAMETRTPLRSNLPQSARTAGDRGCSCSVHTTTQGSAKSSKLIVERSPKLRLHSADVVAPRACCGVGAALLFAWLAFAQTGPAGHWEGTIKGDDGNLGISLDLAVNANSQWIASMGVTPDVKGLVVTDIAVVGKSVKFTAAEMMMIGFDLKLDSGGILKGAYVTRQGSFPVEFRRTGEAKVELIPASPAVSKELEGDWEGTLGSGTFLFHFKNQPDKTVTATIDTPASRAFGLPLDNVKQTGRNIEFGIRVAHAAFKGILNQEGTELAGQFMHESEGVPLTLRKK